MTPFKAIAIVQTPAPTLYTFMRDHLTEIAPDLADIRSIRTVERRKRADGTVLLVNEWRAAVSVPSALRGIVGSDDLGWIDRAEYAGGATLCRWRIEPFFLGDHIRCEGTTTYATALAGRGARVSFEGGFELDPVGIQEHVRVLQQPVTRLIESIVTTMIPRNFRRMIDAAARRAR